jgi:hypothetical protein
VFAKITGEKPFSDWVQTVRSNRDQLIIMVDEIHEILRLIIHLYSEAESAGTLSTVVLSDIAKFTEYVLTCFRNEILIYHFPAGLCSKYMDF